MHVLVPHSVLACMVHACAGAAQSIGMHSACMCLHFSYTCVHSVHVCLCCMGQIRGQWIHTCVLHSVCRAHGCAECCRSCTNDRTTKFTESLRPMGHTSGSIRELHTHRKPAWVPHLKHWVPSPSVPVPARYAHPSQQEASVTAQTVL